MILKLSPGLNWKEPVETPLDLPDDDAEETARLGHHPPVAETEEERVALILMDMPEEFPAMFLRLDGQWVQVTSYTGAGQGLR